MHSKLLHLDGLRPTTRLLHSLSLKQAESADFLHSCPIIANYVISFAHTQVPLLFQCTQVIRVKHCTQLIRVKYYSRLI